MIWRATAIFLAVYADLILSKRHRPHIAWGGILLALFLRVLDAREILAGVDWGVIGILVGSLLLAELVIVSRFPETISDVLINHSPSLGVAFLSIIILTSVLSAFIENVATVLIVAPIALELARKVDVSPVPVIIGLAISSNLQGTATLIGDPPSMILAAAKGMNFLDFFWYGGRVGIFFFVQIGAIFGFAVLFLFLKGMRRRPVELPVTKVRSWVPVWLLGAMIVLLSLVSIVKPGSTSYSGVVCTIIAIVGLLWYLARDRKEARKMMRRFDWGTTAFVAAVFILVAMLENKGVIKALVDRLSSLEGMSRFAVYSIVVWLSVLISAFIDNVPYITAVLPVVIGLAAKLGITEELLVFGVLIGSCLGGNITPIGASANIVAVGILGREGKPVSFGSFVRIGLPFTLAATAGAFIALWLAWN